MEIQWYAYKDYQIEGPYSFNELKQEVETGRLNPDDLIWNHTMREWIEASQISEFENTAVPELISLPPYSEGKKSFLSNLNYSRVAIILIATFLLSLSATSFYLILTRDDETAENDSDADFAYNTIFEDLDTEENDIETAQDQEDELSEPEEEVLNEPEPADLEEEQVEAVTGEQPDVSHLETSAPQTSGPPPAGVQQGGPAPDPADEDPAQPANQGEQDYMGEEIIEWRGGLYKGPLLDGEPHGQGIWRHPDGRSYSGEFWVGTITGYGAMTFPGGERYTGGFLNGKSHGDGTLVHPQGRKYAGEFKHGIIDGYGTMTFPGGERYMGYFKNGLGHGQGTMYHPDGRSVSGIWVSGKLTEKN